MDECCLLLRGDFFIRDSLHECPPNLEKCDNLKSAGFSKIGNTSTCEVNIESRIVGKENPYHRVSPENRLAIDLVLISLTIECVSKNNLLLGFMGKQSINEKESLREIACFQRDKSHYLLQSLPHDLMVAGVDSFGNIVQILHADDDFILEENNLEILNIQDIDERVSRLVFNYDVVSSEVFTMAALKGMTRYKDVIFKGRNVSNDEAVEARFFRVLFNPLSQFDLISKDQFFNLPLNGIVEESNNGYFTLKTMRKNDESGVIIY